MMKSTVIARPLERMPYLDLNIAIAKNWSPSVDFFISIVHAKMSSQFEEYPEAPNIVILPAKTISHTMKPSLPKKELNRPYLFFVLCNTRTWHQHFKYKGALKEMQVLVQHGSASHPADISQRYKNVMRSQHTCAGKSPSYSQSPRWGQCEAAIKACPWQGRGCAGVPPQHSAPVSTYCPKPSEAGGLGPVRGTRCVPLPAQGKAESIQTKASSWKGKLLLPPGQYFTEQFAILPSQETFLRAETCPFPVIQCRNNDFSSELGGSVSCAWLWSRIGVWQSGQHTPELPSLHPATTSDHIMLSGGTVILNAVL